MSKKQTKTSDEEARQSRKEVLRARRESEQTRTIRIVMAVVAGLILFVIAFALVNELVIAPTRAVAIVNGESISLRDWENRVRYERAQRIILLNNQYDALNGDVGLIQQYASQPIIDLLNPEDLGQSTLDQMINEVVIRQAAEARGITVTDEDVEKKIGESFRYYGGESPTATPTPTETIQPTPSLTPISEPISGTVTPTSEPLPTATQAPTSTPLPTATLVSQESFKTQLDELIAKFEDLGVNESIYRQVVRAQIYQERLADAVAKEQNLPTEGEQASFFLLFFDTEAGANEALANIQAQDFLTVWNTIRSLPANPDATSVSGATELLWRTQDELVNIVGTETAAAAFNLPIGTPSGVLKQPGGTSSDGQSTNPDRYFIIQVSGREERPLPQATLDSAKQTALGSFIDAQLTGNLQQFEFWRSRVPTLPALDPKFTAQATPTPAAVVPTSAPVSTVELTPASEDSAPATEAAPAVENTPAP